MPQVWFVDQSLIDFYMFNTQILFETCLVSSRIDEKDGQTDRQTEASSCLY